VAARGRVRDAEVERGSRGENGVGGGGGDPCRSGPGTGDAGTVFGPSRPSSLEKLDSGFPVGQGRRMVFVRVGQCPGELYRATKLL
jgi:hypothetical protein